MAPRLEIAFRAIKRDRREDLRGLRFTALAFKVAVRGPAPIAVAYAIDDEGIEHWLAARSASHGVEQAYVELLSDLLDRGLAAQRPPIVDAGGYPKFARRLEHALGAVLHVGAARECGSAGLAW
ncbi:MAG: hypothetical protein ACLQVI_28165 [Polyangiaceae bacterium]